MLNDLFSYFTSESEQSTLQEVETEIKELQDVAAQARASGARSMGAEDIREALKDVLQLQDEFIHTIYNDGSNINARGYDWDKVEDAEQKAKQKIEAYASSFDTKFDELKQFKQPLSQLEKMEDALNQPTGTDELRAKYQEVTGEIIETIQDDWIEQLRDYQLFRDKIPSEPGSDQQR